MLRHAQMRFLGHVLRRPADDAPHRILNNRLPIPGKDGYANSNLLRQRIQTIMDNLHISPAMTTADNGKQWNTAISALLRPLLPAPAAATASSSSGPRRPPTKTATKNTPKRTKTVPPPKGKL